MHAGAPVARLLYAPAAHAVHTEELVAAVTLPYEPGAHAKHGAVALPQALPAAVKVGDAIRSVPLELVADAPLMRTITDARHSVAGGRTAVTNVAPEQMPLV